MDTALIRNAKLSEEAGQQLLAALDDSISAWMSDQRIDSAELQEILALESMARAQIEEYLIPSGNRGEDIANEYPGSPLLVITWLQLANLVLMDGVRLNPFEVRDEARSIIGTDCSLFVIREMASFGALKDYTLPKPMAALIYLGLISEEDELNDLLDLIEEKDAVFGEEVRNYALAMSDQLQSQNEEPDLYPMNSFLEAMEEGNSKDYRKHYSGVQAAFRNQGYVTSTWVSDADYKTVHLLFGDEYLAMSHEKTGIKYLARDQVRGVVIGTTTERMHTGFSYTDYHKWTVDIYSNSGASYHYTAMLSSGNDDPNPRREALTKVFSTAGDYYPVTSSGRHTVSESGYRTTMTYWF